MENNTLFTLEGPLGTVEVIHTILQLEVWFEDSNSAYPKPYLHTLLKKADWDFSDIAIKITLMEICKKLVGLDSFDLTKLEENIENGG